MEVGRDIETAAPGGGGAEARTCRAIIEGIRRRDPRAALLLHDHFGALINRMVWRLLGADREHDDAAMPVRSGTLTVGDGLVTDIQPICEL